MKKLLILLLSLCVFVISCDNMQKPAMDVVGDVMTPTEEPSKPTPETESDPVVETPEPELPKIDFLEEVDRSIPEDVEIFASDRVFHNLEIRGTQVKLNAEGEPDLDGELHTFEPFIFEDARSALTDENVLKFFEWWELNIKNYCVTGKFSNTGYLFVYFSQREEADKFQGQFVDMDPWRIVRTVNIIDNEKVQFIVALGPDNSKFHNFCQ